MKHTRTGMFYSPSAGGFYSGDSAVPIPADAVKITHARYCQLLDAQSEGAEIAAHPRTGNPLIRKPRPPAKADLQRNARVRIRAEAARRMGKPADLWAMFNALRRHVIDGAPIPAEMQERFAAIDAIEAAADRADKAIARLKDPSRFDPADDAHWKDRG